MITQIETYKLVPHPGNPRLDVGDLAELTDSIRENGIFQNLTVVPASTAGVYKVVIGHRRLQAAILAGLETVPCAVVEMDDKTQYSTMLLENMQRSDLTPYEQAQGIQQCLDLGMTETEISKKTGFSKKTVKRRLKMLELDQEKMKQAQGRMEDYIALEQIKDVEKRNDLLKHMGTNNFLLEVEKAKDAQVNSEENVRENTESVSNLTDSVSETANTVIEEPKIIKISEALRLNFIKEVFKRKIAPNEVAKAVGIVNELFIVGSGNSHFKIFNDIVNPNSITNKDLIERMQKHRSNFLVVAAFDLLEGKKDKNDVYNYLEEFGYVMSDDEKRMIEDA